MKASSIYKQVVRDLKDEGSATCELYGKSYRFDYDESSGCELYIDGCYSGILGHCCEIRDLIEDVLDSHF